MTEAIFLLTRAPAEPADVIAVPKLSEDSLNDGERVQRGHPLGARLQLAWGLRSPQQQDGEHRELLAVQTQAILGEVAVLGDAGGMAARQPRQAVLAQPLRRRKDGVLVIAGHRITVGRLVAGETQRVDRQRILVRRRPALLDQAAEHALLGLGQLAEVHGARIGQKARGASVSSHPAGSSQRPPPAATRRPDVARDSVHQTVTERERLLHGYRNLQVNPVCQ
jgi:hypothetical protein